MKKVFENNGSTFSGIYAAEKWAKENGYTVGSMERGHPIGLADASQYEYVSKWTNMTAAEHKLLAGTITCDRDGFRTGTATIEIK